MRPTETLMTEHRLIEKILGVLDLLAGQAAKEGSIDRKRATDTLSFLRQFADRCHHGKEERHLFPRLAAHGLGPEMGPVAVMLQEHEEGRARIREMAAALDDLEAPGALDSFARAARAYSLLLSNHIGKEDGILFQIADQVLTDEDVESIAAGFEAVERDEMGAGAHERLHALADQILAGVNV